MKLSKIILLGALLLSIISPTFNKGYVYLSETQEEKASRLSKEIAGYEREITKLQSESNTLSNQIAQYDIQIKLTSLKVTDTEEKISLLGGRIDQLEVSLTSLSNAFTNRAVQTYKMSKVNSPMLMILTSSDLSSIFTSYHYLKRILEADRDLLIRLEEAQQTYKDQKSDQERLQEELKKQQQVLGSQKAAKANLLLQTKNDERKYQQLLNQARSEFEAIQAILAGRGDETEVGKVSEGQRIASIIQGASCNSSGEHLHFIVSRNGITDNPFNYLKSIDYENCSGSNCGSGDGDSFNPGGSWEWPITPKIKFSQGYGSTWAVKNTWVGRVYSFHNGVDVNSSSSSEVKAVKAGTLYRGSYAASSGCRLRYVRIDHDDGDLDTFYLHINY